MKFQPTCWQMASWAVLLMVYSSAASSLHDLQFDYDSPTLISEHETGPAPLPDQESLFFLDNVPHGVMKVKAGDKVVLDCEASGRPTPTIHWLFNGKRITQGEDVNVLDDEAAFETPSASAPSLRVGSTKSRLFVDCFSSSQAGKYTCVAETPEGRITSTVTLKTDKTRAYIPAKCSSKRNNQGGHSAARIFMWTLQRLEFEGQDVQLYCRAQGEPAPAITWLMDGGKPVDVTHSKYTVLPSGDLLVKDVSWVDMGQFTCVAENEYGTDEAGVFLYPTTP